MASWIDKNRCSLIPRDIQKLTNTKNQQTKGHFCQYFGSLIKLLPQGCSLVVDNNVNNSQSTKQQGRSPY